MLRESSGNYKADSGSSVGLMQVNWNVHKDLLRVHFGVNNRNKLFDPKLNILVGSFLLKRYYEDEDTTKEDRQSGVGLDDDFVEILEAYKLENYPHEIKF